MNNILKRIGTLALAAAALLAATPAARALDAKNAFAYDVSISQSGAKVTVNYKLSAAPKSVTVKINVAGTPMSLAGTTGATNAVTFDVTGKPNGTISASVEVTSNTVSAPTRVTPQGATDSYGWGLVNPRGLAINNCTDSPTFGMIVATETFGNVNFPSNYLSGTNGRGSGIYPFTADFQPIKNSAASNKYGYTANLANGYSYCPNNAGETYHNFDRVAFSDDGRLFFNRYTHTGHTLYEANPENLNATAFNIYDGTVKGDDFSSGDYNSFVYNGSTPVMGVVLSVDAVGRGSDLKLALITSYYRLGKSMTASQKTAIVPLGTKGMATGQRLTTAPGKWFTNWYLSGTQTTVTCFGQHEPQTLFTPDGLGTIFSTWVPVAGQSSPTTNNGQVTRGGYYWTASSINQNSATAYNSGFGHGYGGLRGNALARSADGKRIAICTGNPEVAVYDVTYSGGKITSATLAYKFTPNSPARTQSYKSIGTAVTSSNTIVNVANGERSIDGMAFDYAGNLYISSRATQRVECYAIPQSNYLRTTPLAASKNITRTVTVAAPAVTATPAGGTDVLVQWTTPTVNGDVVKTYKLEYQAPGSTTWTVLAATLPDSQLSYTHQGALTAQGGKYRVTATASNGTVGTASAAATVNTTPVAPASLSGSTAWDTDFNNMRQLLTLTWPKGVASTYNIYANGTLMATGVPGSATTWTGEMPMKAYSASDGRYQFQISSVILGSESAKTQSAVIYHQDYQPKELALTGTVSVQNGARNIRLNWQPPTHGMVERFDIYEETTSPAKMVKSVNGQTFTVTLSQGATTRRFRVYAVMTNSIAVSSTLLDKKNIISNQVTVTDHQSGNAPTITQCDNYDGYTTVGLTWSAPSGVKPLYYRVYRDGILVADKADCLTYVDTQVPNGQHRYTVAAVYNTTTEVISAERTIRVVDGNNTTGVRYDDAMVNYTLEVVYNYPIRTWAEYEADGRPAGTVVSDAIGFRNAVGAWGGPGDAYRQAAFWDGNWYIAQLTDAQPTLTSGGQNDYTRAHSYIYNMPAWNGDYESRTRNGGIIVFNADNPLASDNNNVMRRKWTLPALTNQSIAFDQGGFLYFRDLNLQGAYNDNLSYYNTTYLWYTPWRRLGVIHAFNGQNWGCATGFNFGSAGSPDLYSVTADANGNRKASQESATITPTNSTYSQYYRTHFISADGNAANSTAHVYMAMNYSRRVYRQFLKNDAGHIVANGYQLFSPKGCPGLSAEPTEADTEQYAFPFYGRDGFIHEMRGAGYYYVDNATGNYTPMVTGHDSYCAGGLVFDFPNQFSGEKEECKDIFFIYPTTLTSKSIGNFSIVMPKRAKSASHTSADITKLVPVASYIQEEINTYSSTNSNACWFATKYSASENCVYIYQYVPGVRMAKYRLKSYSHIPPVKAGIKVDIIHDSETDPHKITHFRTTLNWTKPANNYGTAANRTFEHSGFNVRLVDGNNVLIKAWNNLSANTLSVVYEHNVADQYHIDSRNYSVRVTPLYTNRETGSVIAGLEASATNHNTFTGSINAITPRLFRRTSDGANRIEIDFDPANLKNYPEPVNFFSLDYSLDGGRTFTEIPNLVIMADGQHHTKGDGPMRALSADPHSPQGFNVPGNYRFGTNGYPAGDKDTPCPQDRTSQQAVAYHYVYDSELGGVQPQNIVYRATAHYAAENPYIHQSYTTQSQPVSTTMTGIDDPRNQAFSQVRVFPVPATTTLNVESREPLQLVRIFAVNSATVLSQEYDGTQTTAVLNIATLPAGVYTLQANRQAPVRFIKH